jgi:hypothetical protein
MVETRQLDEQRAAVVAFCAHEMERSESGRVTVTFRHLYRWCPKERQSAVHSPLEW